eukprot:scaffold16660_cov35-Cyclotella_meneghiniana.AAC.3
MVFEAIEGSSSVDEFRRIFLNERPHCNYIYCAESTHRFAKVLHIQEGNEPLCSCTPSVSSYVHGDKVGIVDNRSGHAIVCIFGASEAAIVSAIVKTFVT